MNSKSNKDTTAPGKEANIFETGRINRDNHQAETGDRLTIFGHSFSITELQNISSFASWLESIASESLRSQPKIPEGALFIMKVGNGGMEVSFGGLSKR